MRFLFLVLFLLNGCISKFSKNPPSSKKNITLKTENITDFTVDDFAQYNIYDPTLYFGIILFLVISICVIIKYFSK